MMLSLLPALLLSAPVDPGHAVTRFSVVAGHRLALRDVDGDGRTDLLEVRDDGVGLPAGEARQPGDGLGMKVVEALVEQIRGELVLKEAEAGQPHATVLAVRFSDVAVQLGRAKQGPA